MHQEDKHWRKKKVPYLNCMKVLAQEQISRNGPWEKNHPTTLVFSDVFSLLFKAARTKVSVFPKRKPAQVMYCGVCDGEDSVVWNHPSPPIPTFVRR